ncbi:MAG: sodium:proton antiporter [Hyphomicrobiales bacterium]
MTTALLIICLFTVCFCMIAKRISKTILTAPMVFIGFGFLMAQTGVMPTGEAEHLLHLVAEIALIILLFLDAAQIDFNELRKRHVWPVRMLAVGLPLCVVFGTAVAWLFLPDWPIFAVVLLAAILAPTDAALGQAVVTNLAVPERVRRALTVESGLNDGLALPAILLFASLAAGVAGQTDTNWFIFGAKQLIFGPLVGIAVGFIGGHLLIRAQEKQWTSAIFEGIAALSMAGFAYLAATTVGGNGFISAFVAGLLFGNVVKGRCKFIYEFNESEGQMLTWGAFFLLGLALVPEAIHHLSVPVLAIIFLSLFVVRPLSIWISLIKTDAQPTTRLFFGWFGPRGLATALFALLIVPMVGHELAEPILYLAVNAVWISALLHGLSAVPGANWYGSWYSKKSKSDELPPN